MFKLISIDPGKYKCGLVLAEMSEKKVYKAIIIKSEVLEDYLRNLKFIVLTLEIMVILLILIFLIMILFQRIS